jgi:hypothetical protein
MAEAIRVNKGVGLWQYLRSKTIVAQDLPRSRVCSVTLTLKKKNFMYERKQLSKCSQKGDVYTEKCIKVTITVNLCSI